MGRFKLYFTIFLINLYTTNSQISDKRLCVDEECKTPVSLAYTLMKYNSPDPRILSFIPNAKVTIYSKSAGSRADLWGAEINGKRGYVPVKLVRETKVLNKPKLLVDTEISNESQTPKVPVIEGKLDPDKVKEAFEVIDGTTIPVDPQTIVPSTTENPILATASPADVASQKEATQSSEAEKDAKDTDTPKLEQENTQNEETKIDSSEAEDDAEKPSDAKDTDKGKLEQESIEIEDIEIDSEPYSNNTVKDIETKQTELSKEDHQESLEGKSAEDRDKLVDKNEENKNEETEDGVLARLSSWITSGTSNQDGSASNTKDDVEIETDEDEGEDDEGEDDEGEDDEDQEEDEDEAADAEIENSKEESKVTSVPDIDTKLDPKADDEKGNSKEESKATSLPDIDTKLDPTVDTYSDQSSKRERKTVESENEAKVSSDNDEISKLVSSKASEKIEAEKTETSQNSKSEISDPSNKVEVLDDASELEKTETIKNSKPYISDTSSKEKVLEDSNEVAKESNEEVNVKSRENNFGQESSTDSVQVPKIDVPLKEGSTEMPVLSSLVSQQQSSSQVPKKDVPLKEIPVLSLLATEIPATEIPSELPKPLDVSANGVTPNPAHTTPKTPAAFDGASKEESVDETEKTPKDAKSDENVMSSPKVLPLESSSSPDDTKKVVSEAVPVSSFDFVENVKKLEDHKVESFSNSLAQESSKEDSVTSSSPQEPSDSNYDPYALLNAKNDSEALSKDDAIKTESSSSQKEKFADERNKIDIPDHTHTFEDAIKPNTEKIQESEVWQKELRSDVPKAAEEVKAAGPGLNLEKSEVKSSSVEEVEIPGIFDNIYSYFGASQKKDENSLDSNEGHTDLDNSAKHQMQGSTGDELFGVDEYCDADPVAPNCRQRDIRKESISEESTIDDMDSIVFTSDILTYLVTTAVSVIIFLLGYIVLDRSRREGPLIAKLDKLEKECLVLMKENQILQEKVEGTTIDNLINTVPNAVVDELKEELMELQRSKAALEEQVQSLEKELENSTEVGMELNKMLSDILNSQSGSDTLKANIEQLQRQLVEQQATINSINETLSIKDTENHELHLELEISNKKVVELQSELDKLLLNILKIEEEKDLQQNNLEAQVNLYKQKYEEIISNVTSREESFNNEIQSLKIKLSETQRSLELKTKEYDILKENLESVQNSKNGSDTLKSLVDASSVKAELEQLKSENQTFIERFRQEEENRYNLEKKLQSLLDENGKLKDQYDEADKQKLEAQTKLEVLSNYFKEKETQMQKELSKHESMWLEKQGEASSTIERIKFMQEELQNYKAQNEALKQEILAQEVDLKSQISVLEKKVNDNWVLYRQTERRLEDAKQEAAQLRNRLTLRERAIIEEKAQNRLQSPLEQNGELPLSPLHMESFGGSREHIANSPPIPPPGLPPFLPPPPPFMPPPPGLPPFMPPPPPGMFPGDHRPPPLGRMSSPPLNSRFSPDSRVFSPYDRNSPSPTYDSEYEPMSPPPPISSFSPYGRDDRRDYKRPMPQPLPPIRTNGRSQRGANMSSGGSGHSNESLERIHKHSKV